MVRCPKHERYEKMQIKNAQGKGCYRIENAPIFGRGMKDNPEWGADDWEYCEGGDLFGNADIGRNPSGVLTAIFPTADGEGVEEIEVDLSQGFAPMHPKLFSRVVFMRGYVEKVLRARQAEAA